MGPPPPSADPYSHGLSAPPSHHALVTIVSPPNQLQSTVYPTATARDLLPRPLPPGLSIIRPLPISAATTGRWFPVRQPQYSTDINLKVLVSQHPSHSLSFESDSLVCYFWTRVHVSIKSTPSSTGVSLVKHQCSRKRHHRVAADIPGDFYQTCHLYPGEQHQQRAHKALLKI